MYRQTIHDITITCLTSKVYASVRKDHPLTLTCMRVIARTDAQTMLLLSCNEPNAITFNSGKQGLLKYQQDNIGTSMKSDTYMYEQIWFNLAFQNI